MSTRRGHPQAMPPTVEGVEPPTCLGLGSGPLGGFPGAPVNDETAQATLEAAWQAGVRAFDTAPWYGLGAAEQRLGRFLAGLPRDEFALSTKVGRVLSPLAHSQTLHEAAPWANALPMGWRFDYTRDGVMRSFEASRERLGVERFDALLIHDLEPAAHGNTLRARFDELDRGGGFAALAELRSSGAVGAIGLGVNQADAVEPVLSHFDLDVVLLAGSYTLLNTSALDRALPLCFDRGVDVVIGGVFNSGVLVTGPIAGASFDYHAAPASVLESVRRLGEICDTHRVELGAAALAFTLAHPAVGSVLVGAASPAEARMDVRLLRAPIPAGFWTQLRGEGLLRDDAPVPEGGSA